MIARAREYFATQEVLEVSIPALGPYAGSDPNIDCLTVNTRSAGQLFLHTSPELGMKRLLAAGYPDIYSLGPVYRDGELGRRHVPEFTMLEWYRRGFGLDDIIEDTARLIAVCLDTPDLARKVAVIDYVETCEKFTGIDPLTATVQDLARCLSADQRLRATLGDDRDAWLDLLVCELVLPRLPTDRLTVIRHYPASQAALARLCPADPRIADRFEVFFGDMELANGYVELTDAAEQRQRIEADLQERRRLGRPVHPWDRSLIAALEHGLPDCAGVAVGVERIHMLLDRAEDISQVMTFSFGRRNDRA